MDHADHVELLHKGVPGPGGIWADLGSGSGAFTLALAELIGPQGVIYSVDRDRRLLAEQEQRMRSQFPQTVVHYLAGDFTRPLQLPPLDGVVMANSLHFHRRKTLILETVRTMLRPGGRLLLVEYNTDRGNTWVPHPITYPTWEALARRCGFVTTRKIGARPSRFLGEIYAAESLAPGVGPGG